MPIYVWIPIIALMIPIASIVMRHWRAVQERRLDLVERGLVEQGDAAAQRLAQLESRVQVLERIVTDSRRTLAAEIDSLPDGQDTQNGKDHR